MKVKATKEYVNRNLKDKDLDKIPKEGEVFEVTDDRYKVLHGNNPWNAIFVEKVNEISVEQNIIEPRVETATKKRTAKKKVIK